jgi:hypothetical protein
MDLRHISENFGLPAGTISRRNPGRTAVSRTNPGETAISWTKSRTASPDGKRPAKFPGRDLAAIFEINNQGDLNQNFEPPVSPILSLHSDKNQSTHIHKKMNSFGSSPNQRNFMDGILPGNDSTHEMQGINQNFEFENTIASKIAKKT